LQVTISSEKILLVRGLAEIFSIIGSTSGVFSGILNNSNYSLFRKFIFF